MRLRLRFCLGLLVTVVLFGSPAHAQSEDAWDGNVATVETSVDQDTASPSPRFPNIFPNFGQGFANDEEIRLAVGTPTYKLDSPCNENDGYLDSRTVRVELEKLPDNFGQRGSIIDAILKNAAEFAWESCPRPYYFLGDRTNDFHYNLKRVNIYGPNDELLVSSGLGSEKLDGTGDQFFRSSPEGYHWLDYRDVLGERQAQAVQEAAQEEQQRAAAAAQQARELAAQEQERENSIAFWSKARLFAFFAFLFWLFLNREAIARWYYALKPHPAMNIVDSAIYSGAPIDGNLYQRVLSPIPGSHIEQQVRTGQARDLTARLRTHEAALNSESARHIDRERRRVEQENAFARAHIELLRAGIDHEIAAARIDELRKAMQHHD